MPRDLTDLFEQAVSSAPPEPHHAGDIVRLAERRQRRRTTVLAAGAVLAVVAAAGGAFGLTRDHAASPEPAGRYRQDQTVDVTSAVPASSVPGYRVEPWTIPSLQQVGSNSGPLPTYRQIDADGRLIVEDTPGGNPRHPLRIRLYAAPGQQPQPLQVPTPLGAQPGRAISWEPSFMSDGRLLWSASGPVSPPEKTGFHVTDLDGAHDVFVPTHLRIGPQEVNDVTRPWVSGDHIWFTSFDSATPDGALSHSLYMATFSGAVTKVADRVAVADVADGTVGWVTLDGQVVTESAAGGPQHRVPVPLTAGCRMPTTLTLQNEVGARALAVNRSVIALPEACGKRKTGPGEMLAFDHEGHPLVHVTGAYALDPSLGQDDLVFQGLVLPAFNRFETLRYDFVTGTLTTLGPGSADQSIQPVQAAGNRVLWYDAQGGHVGEFTG